MQQHKRTIGQTLGLAAMTLASLGLSAGLASATPRHPAPAHTATQHVAARASQPEIEFNPAVHQSQSSKGGGIRMTAHMPANVGCDVYTRMNHSRWHRRHAPDLHGNTFYGLHNLPPGGHARFAIRSVCADVPHRATFKVTRAVVTSADRGINRPATGSKKYFFMDLSGDFGGVLLDVSRMDMHLTDGRFIHAPTQLFEAGALGEFPGVGHTAKFDSRHPGRSDAFVYEPGNAPTSSWDINAGVE